MGSFCVAMPLHPRRKKDALVAFSCEDIPHVQRFIDLPSKNVLEERSLEPSNKLQMKTLKERSTKNVLRTFQRKHIRTCSSEAFH